MNKRLVFGIATAAVAVSGFGATTAIAQPPTPALPGPGPAVPAAPVAPGTDVESMISHCTEQLPEDQRHPAAGSMRQVMAENMMGDRMRGMTGDG